MGNTKTLEIVIWLLSSTDPLFFMGSGFLFGYLFGLHHVGSRLLSWAFGRYSPPFSFVEQLQTKREFSHTCLFIIMTIAYLLFYKNHYDIGGLWFLNPWIFALAFTVAYTIRPSQKKTAVSGKKRSTLLKEITRWDSGSHFSYLYGVFGIGIGADILRRENLFTEKWVLIVIVSISVMVGGLLANKNMLLNRKIGVDYKNAITPLLLILGIVLSVVFGLFVGKEQNLLNFMLGIASSTWGGILLIQSILIDLRIKHLPSKFGGFGF